MCPILTFFCQFRPKWVSIQTSSSENDKKRNYTTVTNCKIMNMYLFSGGDVISDVVSPQRTLVRFTTSSVLEHNNLNTTAIQPSLLTSDTVVPVVPGLSVCDRQTWHNTDRSIKWIHYKVQICCVCSIVIYQLRKQARKAYKLEHLTTRYKHS